jgi:predicted anti-sigma-YlaC factor YlaD
MPANGELTCQQLVGLVTEYIEGTLPLIGRARFDAHLDICPHCRIYLEQMRQTIRLTGRLREEDVPTRVMEDLLRVFRGWRRT